MVKEDRHEELIKIAGDIAIEITDKTKTHAEILTVSFHVLNVVQSVTIKGSMQKEVIK